MHQSPDEGMRQQQQQQGGINAVSQEGATRNFRALMRKQGGSDVGHRTGHRLQCKGDYRYRQVTSPVVQTSGTRGR